MSEVDNPFPPSKAMHASEAREQAREIDRLRRQMNEYDRTVSIRIKDALKQFGLAASLLLSIQAEFINPDLLP